ncbi:MAG: alanine--tRNA ligase [Planctomycetes bacterium]|nr:alanine--tRNA ligase [Planctomycetota bacterium]
MPKPFTVAEIREAYLAFFAEKNCVRYASASLVPENDPTTLFTVAGMSQFKDMFLGRGTHPFTRATTVQKCIRTNDIMNVGRTARHHTFFEMLGNFSFNDYFKREAIVWAWEFLTERLGLDKSRLSISVHTIDDEAYRIWRDEVGIPPERIFKMGDNDNFWPANAPKEGPEGPGGCCSEIFWDHRTNNDPNDNLTSSTGRFVEIWNLVFPEFNVRKPHADGSPNLENLGRRNIDTGSGLERVAAVMQGVYNNFDIDVFQAIITSVCAVSGKTYDTSVPLGTKSQVAEDNALIRRIADHVRAVTFCIADGALPGNSDRGYIVRRLIRRATLDMDKLGVDEARLHDVVPAVIASMGTAYPEIVRRQDLAKETLKAEEQLFRRTLRKGLDLFQRSLDKFKGGKVFSGDDAFELVTTHGFPKEVIAELAGGENLTIDDAQFKLRWDEHTRVSNTKQIEVFTSTALQEAKPRLGATPFVGYQQTEVASEITLLEAAGKQVDAAPVGTEVRFALKQTPFYAESGGQVGDRGSVSGAGFTIQVSDTQKDEGLVIHHGKVTTGVARPGAVTATVDQTLRRATTRHHSATHLMHSALARVLGDHVEQQGSKVEPAALRFDFNHPNAMTREQVAAIERWVNDTIAAKHPVEIRVMPIAEAKTLGAKAQFGEKYGTEVRVVTMGTGDVSREFCGGCHVGNTGDIGAFRIVSEAASSAGIRRIVAVAGDEAARLASEERRVASECAAHLGLAQPTAEDLTQVDELARQFKAQAAEVPARVGQLAREIADLATRVGAPTLALAGSLLQRVEQLQNEQKRLRKLDEAKQAQAAAGLADAVLAKQVDLAGVPVIAAVVPGLDGKALRTLLDVVRAKRPSLCVVLGSVADGKVGLVAGVSPDLTKRGLSAGTLIGKLAPVVGGKGGGKPDLAQAGGSDAARLPEAIAAVQTLVREALAGAGAGGAKG